jgi:hypothetical protein
MNRYYDSFLVFMGMETSSGWSCFAMQTLTVSMVPNSVRLFLILLHHMPQLMHLHAHFYDLVGPEGARALPTGLRLANRTLECLYLYSCKLFDEGVSLRWTASSKALPP